MHRDLKLENLLLDQMGYIKIIDFGLAKILTTMEEANTFCGTPEYFAPEMITRQGHDLTVDWWAVGILIFEMMFGCTPFFNSNRGVLYSKIKQSRVVFPSKRTFAIEYSDELVDLIVKLLKKNKEERLGSLNDATEILSHPWFAGMDVAALESYQVQAPIIPSTEDSSADGVDVRYFNARADPESLVESIVPVQAKKLISQHTNEFEKFDIKPPKK